MQAEEAIEIDSGDLATPGARSRSTAGRGTDSPNGTIMLSPSTAPRWKIATRALRLVSAALAVRVRNEGAKSPTSPSRRPWI